MFSAKVEVQNPEKIALTLTMTATVEEWKGVAAKMGAGWPDWQFASVVNQAILGTVSHVEIAREVKA